MNLTETAVFTKKALVIGAIVIGLAFLAFFAYKIWYSYYQSTLPVPEEAPTLTWGNLPPLDFPPTRISSSNFSYTVDTPDGKLPSFGKLEKVYFMPKAAATLLAPEKITRLATDLGINSPAQILSETRYRFATDSGKTLVAELDTGNFKFSTQATASAVTEQIREEERLIEGFREVLVSLGVMQEPLLSGPSKILYFKFADGSLINATNQDAEVVQISLWPADIDKKPIVSSFKDKSLLVGIFDKNSSKINNLILLDYTFWPVDLKTSSTYPIITSEEAFKQLQEGKATVIEEPTAPQVSITEVKLGYFQSDKYAPYLQPIYIFIGPKFIAYLPAVTAEHIGQAATPIVIPEVSSEPSPSP